MDKNNYSKRKVNLFIVLEFEKIKYVLTTLKPIKLAVDATNQVKKNYSNWQKVGNTICYYTMSMLLIT